MLRWPWIKITFTRGAEPMFTRWPPAPQQESAAPDIQPQPTAPVIEPVEAVPLEAEGEIKDENWDLIQLVSFIYIQAGQ